MAELPPKFQEKLLAVVKKQAELLASTPDYGKAESESSALAAEQYEEIQRQKAETAALKERNTDLRHNRKLRSAYARWVFCYLVCYSVFVALVLVFSGFGIWGFELAPGVLQFLSGSTAAAAIGLVYAVTNGLFDGIGKR